MAANRMLAAWVVGVLVVAGAAVPLAAQEQGAAPAAAAAAVAKATAAKSAAELLPPTTLFYLEVERPRELINLVLDHPLRKRLEQSPDYRRAFDTPQFKEFQAVVKAVEGRAGVSWREALETGTGGGLVVAVDAATQGVVVLARSTDPKVTEAVKDALFSLARDDAQAKGTPDPVREVDYRGLVAHRAGESIIATVGPWLVISNKPDLSQAIADNLLDARPTLAREEMFVASRELAPGGGKAYPKGERGAERRAGEPAAVRAFLRLAPLRLMAARSAVFNADAKSDNPVAELLFGGLAGVARSAPFLIADVQLFEKSAKLTLAAPNDREWVPQGREFFFAPPGQAGGADAPLKPKGTLLSITTYRDLGAWWQAGPDTYTEGVAARMARTDSELSTFLGGKSFGTDVLGSFAPQIQFVIAGQDYAAAGVPAPTIRLPAGALVFRLREKEAAKADVKKHFRVAFQSIVALANLDGAAKGRPLLEMRTERRGKAQILYATYEPTPTETEGEGDTAESTQPEKSLPAKPQAADRLAGTPAEKDIYYNFSPALVLSADRLMLCSTKQLAEELVDLSAKAGPEKAPQNTMIELSARPIADLLRDNREQLVAQNMLEKGHSREAAEKEVDVFVALVNAIDRARVSLMPTEESISLEVEIEAAPVR